MTERTLGRDVMPIMGGTICSEVPFAMLVPHEAQALKNHGQTLERLAQRGGLSHGEALDIIEGRRWNSAQHCIENERHLINKVREWRASVAKAAVQSPQQVAQPSQAHSQLSVNAEGTPASSEPDEQSPVSPVPPLSDLNDSALPREPL